MFKQRDAKISKERLEPTNAKNQLQNIHRSKRTKYWLQSAFLIFPRAFLLTSLISLIFSGYSHVQFVSDFMFPIVVQQHWDSSTNIDLQLISMKGIGVHFALIALGLLFVNSADKWMRSSVSQSQIEVTEDTLKALMEASHFGSRATRRTSLAHLTQVLNARTNHDMHQIKTEDIRTLTYYCTPKNRDLTLAMLNFWSESGDQQDRRHVEKLQQKVSRSNRDSELKVAVDQCLKAMSDRLQIGTDRETLVRSANAPKDTTLLRPATNSNTGNNDALLRPTLMVVQADIVDVTPLEIGSHASSV